MPCIEGQYVRSSANSGMLDMIEQTMDKKINKMADKLTLEILRFAKEKSKNDMEILLNVHLATNAVIEGILKKLREATIAYFTGGKNDTNLKKNVGHSEMVAG